MIEPTFRDTRTVIYIWGKRLLTEQSGVVGEDSGSAGAASLCHPVVLSSLQDVRVVEVAVGESHALFLSDEGNVFAYGEGAYGQLGLGQVQQTAGQPHLVTGLRGAAVQIATGDFHSLALTEDVGTLRFLFSGVFLDI